MQVVIRVDSSVEIGGGHIMRCLVLANQMALAGARVTFLCRALPGALFQVVAQHGHPCHVLSSDIWDAASDAEATLQALSMLTPLGADWVIVDHYDLDADWESRVRRLAGRLMVVDDLANRPHDCDVLLDQNYYRDMQARYDGLVPEACRLRLGPQFVLLRDEFLDARKEVRVRDGRVNRVLVSFGSSDPTGETLKVLLALASSSLRTIAIDVVVGTTNTQVDRIAELVSVLPNAKLHIQVNHMAMLISAADLGVGAGGATTWERCFLGLPTLTVITAANQLRTTRDLGELNAICVLGEAQHCGVEIYKTALESMVARPQYLRELSHACLNVVPNPPVSVVAELLTVEESA